ncbi:MAG: class I SAM-dependent methyltransferase [Candidatus Gastranaerophilales bacterium]|nr:class I SAM-dependent methyltransferase [Candidatus Gastranaerophilales bacterium]
MFSLRKIGRGLVLPHKKIERYIDIFYKKISAKSDEPILDFGSGTLFWSEKFAEKYQKKVFSVDTLYEKKKPTLKTEKISLFDNIGKMPEDARFSMIFTCDVLHHIKPEIRKEILDRFIQTSKLIVIKDIEAEDFCGNLQNKIHDFVINGEKVYDIYSKDLRLYFKEAGFKVRIFQMKKLGYPHFLLVAYK